MNDTVRRHAFTLVELLVVLGIIVGLLAILLPALNKVRAAGNAAVCQSNLRTMMQSEVIYQGQNKGVFTLDDGLLQQVNRLNNAYYKIQYCPGLNNYLDKDTAEFGATHVSYGWNSWLYFMGSGSPRVPIRWFKVRTAADVVFRADVFTLNATGMSVTFEDNAVADPFRGTGTTPPLTAMRPNFQGRHNGTGSVLWMDGHVSREFPHPVPAGTPIDASNGSAVQNTPEFYKKWKVGYLAPDNADFKTMGTEYYFVFKKDGLATASMSAYTDPSKAFWK